MCAALSSESSKCVSCPMWNISSLFYLRCAQSALFFAGEKIPTLYVQLHFSMICWMKCFSCLSLFAFLSLTLSLFLCLSLSFCLYLSLSLFVCLCLSLSLSLSLSAFSTAVVSCSNRSDAVGVDRTIIVGALRSVLYFVFMEESFDAYSCKYTCNLSFVGARSCELLPAGAGTLPYFAVVRPFVVGGGGGACVCECVRARARACVCVWPSLFSNFSFSYYLQDGKKKCSLRTEEITTHAE